MSCIGPHVLETAKRLIINSEHIFMINLISMN